MDHLSPEWLRAMTLATAGAPDPSDPPDGCVVGYRVDTPEGEVTWTVHLGERRATVRPGLDADTAVVVTYDELTAALIATGRADPARAVLMGQVRLEGDATVLTNRAEALADLERSTAPVRWATTYPALARRRGPGH